MTDIAQIIVQIDDRVIQRLPLTMPIVTIGRNPDNTLALPHPLVARYHAELRMEAEGALLTDIGSASGTFIGDTRLLPNQPRLLRDGETFQIGPFRLTYQGAPKAAVAAAPAPEKPEGQEGTAEEGEPVWSEPVKLPIDSTQPLVRSIKVTRPSTPPPLAQGPVSRYLYDLPIVFHDNDFLGRFLLIFESIWEPLEQRQDRIEMYFDPRTCPPAFLPWLASWVDMPVSPYWPEERLRNLVIEATELHRWRGTRYGLTRMIEICAGVTAEMIDDPERPFVVRIRVRSAEDETVDRALIEELIQTHKPASIGYVLEFEN
ncbi:MAG TPA: phage tail protein [Roseiflexaceae bacterium]|nr:phage tail protein [Roseiflexaceae bacterium]